MPQERSPVLATPLALVPPPPTMPTPTVHYSSAPLQTHPTANLDLLCPRRQRWSGRPLWTASRRTPGEFFHCQMHLEGTAYGDLTLLVRIRAELTCCVINKSNSTSHAQVVN